MREIFIERREKLLRIAIKESGKLYECFIEEERDEPLLGEIYKGIVKNVVPGISSVFVDIGHQKDAHMNFPKNKKYKQGDEVIVEIITEEYGNKGAKITENYSIAGRNVALTANKSGLFISKRMKNEKIIETIKAEVVIPEDVSVTVRTNAEFSSIDAINQDIQEIYSKMTEIKEKSKYSLKPQRVFGENSLLHKVLRDNINSDTTKIVVDSEADYNIAKEYVVQEDKITLELYEEYRTLFDCYGIEKEILKLRNNRVNLKCGGQIVIDKTEAMYTIDINSAKNVSLANAEKTAKETNLEAAIEIGKQVRLRNLSGIIIIDFIKMKSNEAKVEVMKALENVFWKDKGNTNIYPFTELDLVQISRRKRGKSIYQYIEEECDYCKGKGKRLKISYISILIRNEILRVEGANSIKDFYIELNEEYEESVKADMLTFLKDIDGLDKNIYLNFVPMVEYFKVESLIFKNQIENVSRYKVDNIEIC